MSEFEPDSTAEETSTEAVNGAPTGPRWKRVMKRVGIGVGVTVVALIVLAALLYQYGGMWVRTPEMKTAYNDMVAAGTAQPIDYRFTIPIPGCKCHSNDPVLQAKHSVRHVKDCMKCHSTNPPHEEPGVL